MSLETEGALVYVIGVDGSGKSTLLSQVCQTINNFVCFEATSSPAAKAFREQHFRSVVDEELVNRREALFLDLSDEHEKKHNAALASGSNVITTSSSLVTRLSHFVMRSIVSGETAGASPRDVVLAWASGREFKPNVVVNLHAPLDTLRARIAERKALGDDHEIPWGFNSPFFLAHYQEAWSESLPVLRQLGTACLTADTSSTSPETITRMIQESL